MTKLMMLALMTTLLAGCPKDWSKEEQSLSQTDDWIACHFENDAGVERARPDGYQCRPAVCITDGKIMLPGSNPPVMVDQHVAISRGICQQSGTVCSAATRKPCAPNEVCILMEEGDDVQAICADD